MLHLCRTNNKLPILAVNRRRVCNGRKIASDKSAFLYAFAINCKQMIGPTNYRSKCSYSWRSQRIYNVL